MTIELDHTIVPSRDKEAAARFFARIFGLSYDGLHSHFAPVRINDRLTIDFDDASEFDHHHYAFKVSEEDFDAIFGRIQEEGIPYGSGPRSSKDMEINLRRGGRGVYFRDPDGHLLEILTA
ncbi:MAG: VOC family protein [Gammaproteobacteria bacterium]|jgi:catechol 2,3-dioxygenase-like lactoylglutathione lyase family enzyme